MIKEFIKRTAAWQLTRMWLVRIKLLKVFSRNNISDDLGYIKIKREIDCFKTGKIYDFNGIKLPLSIITADTFLNVLKPFVKNIQYTPESVEKFYEEQKKNYKTLLYYKDKSFKKEREFEYAGKHLGSHGFTYFFNEIMIKEGDTVIDLGAAPGDFSAACIRYGAAKVYAFEPEENKNSDLEMVNTLNGNKISIIRKYCSAKTNLETNSVSLDDFAKANNIPKIDFIKSDIEGAEAEALLGAKDILKNNRPKLAICDYHNEGDREKIRSMILNANPDYKIYEQKGIIYAY